jgi:hypothetical protein
MEAESNELSKAWILMVYQDLQRSKKNPFPPYSDFLVRMCQSSQENVQTLFLMMAEIRDIWQGKGENEPLFYLADEWAKTHPVETVDALFWICGNVGCWKDLKRWAAHFLSEDPPAPVIPLLVRRINEQLYTDLAQPPHLRSHLAKWVPREKASPRLYTLLAEDWSMMTGQPAHLHPNSKRKEYRQLLSRFHKEYDQTPLHAEIQSLPRIVPLGECIAQLTQEEGIAREKTEKHIQQTLETALPSTLPQAKNLLIVLDPSTLASQYIKQIAILIQAWHVGKTRPQFLLLVQGRTQFHDWSNKYATYAEIVQALWALHIKHVPTQDSLKKFVSGIPLPAQVETAEKMTWILLSDFSPTSVHTILKQRQAVLPHMVYIDASDTSFLSDPLTKTFPCRVVDKRCTMLSATENGLSPNQWTQIILKTQSPALRDTSCWDFLQAVLNPYRAMLSIMDKDRMDICY